MDNEDPDLAALEQEMVEAVECGQTSVDIQDALLMIQYARALRDRLEEVETQLRDAGANPATRAP